MSQQIGNLPVPKTYSRVLLQQQPQHSSAILDATGLSEADLSGSGSITAAQQLRIFLNAARISGSPEWGLKLGQKLNIASHGPLGFAALSAGNLGEGLKVFTDFARCRAPYLDFFAEISGGRYRLSIRQLLSHPELLIPLDEILLQIFQSYLLAVLGSSAGLEIHLAFPPPPHANCYPEYFQAGIRFDATVTHLELPLHLLGVACPLSDAKTYQSSISQCRDDLSALLDPGDAVARVRNQLSAHFGRLLAGEQLPIPTLENTASGLFMSPRTLIRQLQKQNSGFRQLLEEQQRDSACQLLKQAHFSVADVGEMLGYSNTANFSRAFQRWVGTTPGRFRRQR